ncbi:hypothetical protein EJ04DRAFT_560766 [Polyplosphaeria fusca]|uniref:Calcineurin-like phosphoesterase domain-containing protein n=1 Tax=Polyplosphaeria fusca TaxID=682080 RepID=A0A9P4R5G7_9PLEO|nr:hypothetical protein EJ04DRAFT_560766 [Polyplosphaeria fusca]
MAKIPAELRLIIAGNHEISLDRKYYLNEGGVEATYKNCLSLVQGPESLATQSGITFLEEASTIPENIDIVMTHGPPKYILDTTPDDRSAGCEHLRIAIERTHPRLHCFGHVHCGYGAQRIKYESKGDIICAFSREWVGRNQAKKKGYACLPPNSAQSFRDDRGQTLMVNAAMAGHEEDMGNMPWLVELGLETKVDNLEVGTFNGSGMTVSAELHPKQHE